MLVVLQGQLLQSSCKASSQH